MFTGIVEALELASFRPQGNGGRMKVAAPADWHVVPGESVSVSGCCLTIVSARRKVLDPAHPEGLGVTLEFDLTAETLERTHLGELNSRWVNLERAMRLSDRLGGHLVSGHVDGLGTLVQVTDRGDLGREMHFEVPLGLERYLIEKGSITIDGISLTVIEPRDRRFRVAVIPETLERTTLGSAVLGQRVHVEADLVGKWIERLLPEARSR